MAYEKTTWQSGDVVTSEKLNNIENGIANMSMVIHTTDDGAQYVMDKTFGEILEAFTSGTFITVNLTVLHEGGEASDEHTGLVLATFYDLYDGEKSQCIVAVGDASAVAPYKYYANSEDDYPAYYYAD